MKKYLFAALALTALVACSKDDDPTLTSSKKSVVISIANMASNTRAAGATTPKGPNADEVCTSIDGNFYIFFLNNSDKIINKFVGTQLGSYGDGNSWTFNGLDSSVTKVVAAGNLTGSVPEVNTTLDVTSWNLVEADVIALSYEALKDKVVYDIKDLEDTHTELSNMPVWEASLNIAPQMARIEVTQISCTDFGTAPSEYSKIGIKGMSLAGGAEAISNPYTITFAEFNGDSDLEDVGKTQYVIIPDNDTDPTSGPHILKPDGDGTVWSWNIVPQSTTDNTLTTSLYVKAADYTALNPHRTVTINSYKTGTPAAEIGKFNAGNIYRFAINFSHENIDNTENYIIANVSVTIANWVVNNVNVDFATN